MKSFMLKFSLLLLAACNPTFDYPYWIRCYSESDSKQYITINRHYCRQLGYTDLEESWECVRSNGSDAEEIWVEKGKCIKGLRGPVL